MVTFSFISLQPVLALVHQPLGFFFIFLGRVPGASGLLGGWLGGGAFRGQVLLSLDDMQPYHSHKSSQKLVFATGPLPATSKFIIKFLEASRLESCGAP